jgi:hypothetical protein
MDLDLPAVFDAVRWFREAVASDDAAAIVKTEDALRLTLTPSDPKLAGRLERPDNHNPDLCKTTLRPKLEQLLNEVWYRIVRDIHRLKPPFSPDQRREWLILLDEVLAWEHPGRRQETPLVLSDADRSILFVLREESRALKHTDIVRRAAELARDKATYRAAGFISLSETVLEERIPILLEAGLVARPLGRNGKPSKRKGVGITPEGRARLSG